MHELGIAFYAIELLEDIARERGIEHISEVTLELGEVSGIVTDLFEDAWTWACGKHEVVRGSELHIEVVPAITRCNACGETYPTVEHGRICPHCASADTQLAQGQELNIKSITVP